MRRSLGICLRILFLSSKEFAPTTLSCAFILYFLLAETLWTYWLKSFTLAFCMNKLFAENCVLPHSWRYSVFSEGETFFKGRTIFPMKSVCSFLHDVSSIINSLINVFLDEPLCETMQTLLIILAILFVWMTICDY